MGQWQQWCMTVSLACLGGFNLAQATPQPLCVVDLMGANGDTMLAAKDWALAAKDWGVEFEPKVYTKNAQATADFEAKKCAGIVADSFVTKKYNAFMGSIGAVAAIQDYHVAEKVLIALSSPKLASKMQDAKYEVVGYFPYGSAYFITKDKDINSILKMNGKKIGVVDNLDPSHAIMARKVGLIPVTMAYDTAAKQFRNGEFDIIPVPILTYQPFELDKIIGVKGGVLNYPLGFITSNFILAKGTYPEGFAQKSRQWFSSRTPSMFASLQRIEKSLPKNRWYAVPDIDRSGYDILFAQMRKEFVNNGTYNPTMIELIRFFHCKQDPMFIECRGSH